MATKTIKLKARGLSQDDNENWELRLELLGDERDPKCVFIEGTDAELSEFKKRLGKTVDARLVIGAEEDPVVERMAADLKVDADLKAARDRIAEMEKKLEGANNHLQAEQASFRAELDRVRGEQVATTPKVDPNHPVVKAARGALKVVDEKAVAFAAVANKSADAAKFNDMASTARTALREIEQLVGAEKKPANGKPELALAPAQQA